MDKLKKDLKLKSASQSYLKKLKKLLKMYQDGRMSLDELSVVTELDKDKLLEYFHKTGKLKQKILVCGGAGFIGSNFIHHLLRRYPGYEIINYDKLTYAGNLDNLKDIENSPHYKFIKGDIADAKKIEETFSEEKPDMLVNFAAESISGDTYLPIYKGGEIMIETFEELFEGIKNYSQNKVKKTKQGVEVIDIKKGTAYKALSNHGGIGYWRPIRQISRHHFKGNLVCLNQKWGEIVATNNHSLYDIQGELTTPQKNPELLSLRNINYICKKDSYQNFKGKKLESLLRLMAAYITEGNATFNKANGGHIVNIANKDKVWIDTLIEDFKKLGYKPGCLKRKEGWYQLTIVNKDFYNFLRKTCGVYSRHKFIPPFVFQLKPALQRIFLENLIQGDGETIKNKDYNSYRYTTNSKKLATGLSLLLTLLKENFRIYKDERFNAYTLSFGNDYNLASLDKKKKKIPYEGYVYDIEVADTHNFICGVGNVVAHNTHVDRSIHNGAREFLEANVLGVHTLLEAVRKHKTAKYIQISTDETYGTVALDDDRKFTEDTPFAPNVPYAAAKAGGDLMCRAYNKTHNVPVIVTHCSNNYGPYQYPEKLIPFILFKALHKEKLPIYGDGKNVRDWIYVLDHCQAIDDILHQGKPGEVYNIGADQERDNLTVVRAILKILGRSDNLITFVDDRPGHDKRYSIDASKIKKELNWQPTKIFEKTLPNVVDWYLNNQWWIRNIQKKGGAFNIYIKK